MIRCRRVLVFILVLSYWTISLDHLDVFPPVQEDEPWIAAAPHHLATEGVYGSELFTGYYGVERHNYQHMPLFPLLQAAVFKVAGAGVFQMRFLPVAFGLLTLPLVFVVGRQVGGGGVGVLAMALLTGLRLAGGSNWTGIPLLDIARINRYDIAVPVFGLMAFWFFNHAEGQGEERLYLISGGLVGLSSLSHLYGVFWLPALLLVLLCRRGARLLRQTEPYFMLVGFGLAWVPWVAYIASGWADYRGQMRFLAPRFDVFNPHFYTNNLVREIDRYAPLISLDPSRGLPLARPGTWVAIGGLPAALGLVAWHGRRAANEPVFALAGAFVVQALMFAALLVSKRYNYAMGLFALDALVLAWVGVRLWEWRSVTLLRGLLSGLLVVILVDSGLQVAHCRAVAARTTPYARYEARVASHIPDGCRILGLQHYWLGLRHYPYRTWLLPVLLADPLYYHGRLTLDQALERVDPDAVLLDRYMGSYFESIADPSHPKHAQYTEFWEFMDRRQARLTGVVKDATYGTMRIYLLNEAALGDQRP